MEAGVFSGDGVTLFLERLVDRYEELVFRGRAARRGGSLGHGADDFDDSTGEPGDLGTEVKRGGKSATVDRRNEALRSRYVRGDAFVLLSAGRGEGEESKGDSEAAGDVYNRVNVSCDSGSAK